MTMIKCPGCDLELEEEDMWDQFDHMTDQHPEIVVQRRLEAARWDGWEDD